MPNDYSDKMTIRGRARIKIERIYHIVCPICGEDDELVYGGMDPDGFRNAYAEAKRVLKEHVDSEAHLWLLDERVASRTI